MRRNFGVSFQEAAAKGWLTPHRAKAGLRAAGLGAALAYRWSPAWSTTVFAKYERVLGDAADTPIVRTLGQRDQFTIGIGASYCFAIGN